MLKLLNNKNARLIFGKRELKIIEKQLLGINLTQSEKNKIKKIILYGSFAENKFTFNSDIDLSVEFDKINKEEATLFRKRILANSNEKIDIQIYNFLDEKIKKEVIDK